MNNNIQESLSKKELESIILDIACAPLFLKDPRNPDPEIMAILVKRVGIQLSKKFKTVAHKVQEETADQAFDWIWDGWNLDLANKDRAKEQFKKKFLKP